MDTLHQPESIVDDTSTDVETESHVAETEDQLEPIIDHFETTAGGAMVGVINDEDEVLLTRPDGEWYPPSVEVAPDEDWVAVAETEVREQTGYDVSVRGVEKIQVINYYLEGSDDPTLSGYEVFFVAKVVNDRESTSGSEDTLWTGSVPENADPSHEEHVEMYLTE